MHGKQREHGHNRPILFHNQRVAASVSALEIEADVIVGIPEADLPDRLQAFDVAVSGTTKHGLSPYRNFTVYFFSRSTG